MNNGPYVITKFDKVAVFAEECPRAAELLTDYGIHCVGCFFSEEDTLETGAKLHNMTDKELDEMIDEINGQLEKEWREKNKPAEARL